MSWKNKIEYVNQQIYDAEISLKNAKATMEEETPCACIDYLELAREKISRAIEKTEEEH